MKLVWSERTSKVERLEGGEQADRPRNRVKFVVFDVQHLECLKCADVDVGKSGQVVTMQVQNLIDNKNISSASHNHKRLVNK